MQRYWLAVLVMTIAAGSLCAQESTFRYSSDSLGEDVTDGATSANDEAVQASPSDAYRSSYEDAADSKSQVHKNAIFRAEQRRRRIAARKWFGYSNARPIAAAVPYMTPYSPSWVGSPWMPYYWPGVSWR